MTGTFPRTNPTLRRLRASGRPHRNFFAVTCKINAFSEKIELYPWMPEVVPKDSSLFIRLIHFQGIVKVLDYSILFHSVVSLTTAATSRHSASNAVQRFSQRAVNLIARSRNGALRLTGSKCLLDRSLLILRGVLRCHLIPRDHRSLSHNWRNRPMKWLLRLRALRQGTA